jgi:hypothetical protein
MTLPSPLAGAESLSPALATALFIAGELSFLAEADFEEDQEQASAQPGRHQDDREDFSHHSSDQGGAGSACDDQRSRRPKRQDAQARAHGSTVHAARALVSRRLNPSPGTADGKRARPRRENRRQATWLGTRKASSARAAAA